jgi:DNA integrity scanning protein DisA with diadenylate cyclase activity
MKTEGINYMTALEILHISNSIKSATSFSRKKKKKKKKCEFFKSKENEALLAMEKYAKRNN